MLETQAEQDGLVDAPIKHAPEHFEWLALYHFGGWTIPQIADEFEGAANYLKSGRGVHGKHSLEDWSVSRGINDAARHCGLTLNRPLGRPPKTDS